MAATLRHCALLAAIALLGACGTQPTRPEANESIAKRAQTNPQTAKTAQVREEQAHQQVTQALRAALAHKPAPRQITPQDILREWSTMPAERQARTRPRPPAPSAAKPDPAQPEAERHHDAAPAAPERLLLADLMRNQECDVCTDLPFHQHVQSAARTHGVPPALIHAVIQIESGYNPRATSPRQARGLMQVTPATGKSLGVADSQQLYDPKTNIDAGTAYLQALIRQHETVEEVLAAYNAGTGNVRKYGGVPPFQETRNYVGKVKNALRGLRAKVARKRPVDPMAQTRMQAPSKGQGSEAAAQAQLSQSAPQSD